MPLCIPRLPLANAFPSLEGVALLLLCAVAVVSLLAAVAWGGVAAARDRSRGTVRSVGEYRALVVRVFTWLLVALAGSVAALWVFMGIVD